MTTNLYKMTRDYDGIYLGGRNGPLVSLRLSFPGIRTTQSSRSWHRLEKCAYRTHCHHFCHGYPQDFMDKSGQGL